MNIKYRFFSYVLAGVLTLFGNYGKTLAEDSGSRSTLSSNNWEVSIVPYSWLSSMNGDVTVRGTATEVDTNFQIC